MRYPSGAKFGTLGIILSDVSSNLYFCDDETIRLYLV